jgi:4-amino-4-deoxy-L-arabinose transferase-like glycosyltransferase
MKMNKLFKSNWILIIICLLAAFLRLWNLSNVPPHLTPDEASLGYNAYSILKTGRDEHGAFMPIIFKSFGDYKPGLYVYTAIPFVTVLGLSELSVRLPSAIAGTLAVWLVYLITQRFLRITSDPNSKYLMFLPVISAFLVAINPWHIHFSRGAWEITLSLTLTLAGIYFFFKSFEDSKHIMLSAVFFALTLVAYQGAKLSTAIVIIVLSISFYRETIQMIKSSYVHLFIGGGLAFLVVLPILLSFLNGQTGRLSVFSIFSYRRPVAEIQEIVNQGNEKVNGMTYSMFHSEPLNYVKAISGRWFNHFSPRFLFFEGDWQNPRHTPPNHGVITIADLLLLVCGFVFLAKKTDNRLVKFVGLWLILAPLPAALSRDDVHAVRSFNTVIPLTLLCAFGVLYLIIFISNTRKSIRIMSTFFIAACYIFSYIYFLDAYFVHEPIHNAKYWQYGYREVFQKISPLTKNYNNVIVQQSYAQPYIYYLFYAKYPPLEYQKQSNLTAQSLDVGLVEKIDNISFVSFSWPQQVSTKTLIVGDSVSIPDSVESDPRYHVLETIKYPDHTNAFRIVEGGFHE